MTTAAEEQIEGLVSESEMASLPPALRAQAETANAKLRARHAEEQQAQQQQVDLAARSQAQQQVEQPQQSAAGQQAQPSLTPEIEAKQRAEVYTRQAEEARQRLETYRQELQRETGRTGAELQRLRADNADLAARLQTAESRVAELEAKAAQAQQAGDEGWKALVSPELVEQYGQEYADQRAKERFQDRKAMEDAARAREKALQDKIDRLERAAGGASTARSDDAERAAEAGWAKLTEGLRAEGIAVDAKTIDADPEFRNVFLDSEDPQSGLTYRQLVSQAINAGATKPVVRTLATFYRQKFGPKPGSPANGAPPLSSQVQPPVVLSGAQPRMGEPSGDTRIWKESEYTALMALIRSEGPRASEAQKAAWSKQVDEINVAMIEGRYLRGQ